MWVWGGEEGVVMGGYQGHGSAGLGSGQVGEGKGRDVIMGLGGWR